MLDSPNRRSEWGSDGLVRGSGVSMGSAAPPPTQLLLAGIANGDMYPSKTRVKPGVASSNTVKHDGFDALSGQTSLRPPRSSPAATSASRCLPDVPQMPARPQATASEAHSAKDLLIVA